MSKCNKGPNSGARTCPTCNKDFITDQASKVYCSLECYKAAQNRSKPCGICGHEFVASRSKKYCSPDCRQQAHQRTTEERLKKKPQVAKPEPELNKSRRLPVGRYVYGWFRHDEVFPFYIGKGTDDRAWRPHTDADDMPHPCESERRRLGHDFHVTVFRDNLTNEGSLLIESVLIDYFRSIGARLLNVLSGRSRRETPPLTLEALTKVA